MKSLICQKSDRTHFHSASITASVGSADKSPETTIVCTGLAEPSAEPAIASTGLAEPFTQPADASPKATSTSTGWAVVLNCLDLKCLRSFSLKMTKIPLTIIFVLMFLIVIVQPLDLNAQQTVVPQSGMTAGWEDGSFFLSSEDGNYLLNVGGRLQPRYQYQTRIGQEDLSSFFLRRIRLDFRGHIFDEKLTFRIMPEMAAFANLRDGWINYSFSPRLNVKAGQFSVPFHRQRFISGNRQQFAERSLPATEFGFPNGYDIGVGIHGRNEMNTLSYGAGIFDGSGRNIRYSNSPGNMASARVTWAALGQLPRDETAYAYSEDIQLAIGAGLQTAKLNEIRDWDLGRSTVGNTRADWTSGTGDVMLHWMGFSIAADGYIRRVEPDDPALSSYTGQAYMVTGGYFIIEQRLELTGRYSDTRIDRDDRNTFVRDLEAGLNIYHYGHSLKTIINYLNRDLAGKTEHIVLVQLHLMF